MTNGHTAVENRDFHQSPYVVGRMEGRFACWSPVCMADLSASGTNTQKHGIQGFAYRHFEFQWTNFEVRGWFPFRRQCDLLGDLPAGLAGI